MELFHWKGDWGLPSADPTCLSIIAYCKFSKVPIEMKATKNPWKTWSGTLPVFRDNLANVTYTNVEDMLSHLRKESFGSEFDLSPKQSANMIAYISMWNEKFVPAFEHIFWMNSKNYAEFIRPWYASAVVIPLGIFIPPNRRSQIEAKLQGYSDPTMSEKELENKLYVEARECMNLFSVLLGDNSYFFGDQPTMLDAIVFGYLAVLLKAPLPCATLKQHLKSCPNLCTFVNRICDEFFPISEQEKEKLERETPKEQPQDVTEFPHSMRNTILASVVAFGAMIAYAFISGLIRIEISDSADALSTPPQVAPPNFRQFDMIIPSDPEEEEEEEEEGQEEQREDIKKEGERKEEKDKQDSEDMVKTPLDSAEYQTHEQQQQSSEGSQT